MKKLKIKMKRRKLTRLQKLKNSFHIIYLIILVILYITTLYIKYKFPNESIEELLFYLTNGVENSDMTVFINAFKDCFLFSSILILFIISLFYNVLFCNKVQLIFKIKKFNEIRIQLYPISFIYKHKIIFTIILTMILGFFSINNMKGFSFINDNINTSDFIERNYVVPEKTNINFNKKKNLIMIFVESLETTLFTKEQGGDWDYEVIPELYNLLFEDDSIYFASDNKVGGMLSVNTSNWTTGSVVVNTTGLPFKIPINGNEYHSENFMNGAYALGDILKDNGYYNELISASNTSFGGIKEYFTKHGSYYIIDSDNLKKVDLEMKKSDEGPWGFNDRYMFNIAKERLKKISKKETSFNLTLIGIDTHFPNGFKGEYTVDKYDTQYENVYRTESILISDFVNWVKKQDFYDDTTIVILGDHLSMEHKFFEDCSDSLRKRYFLIINSDVETLNNINRSFSALDTYPTVLASLGAQIEDNKLGLGVNLFSDEETLFEQYGQDYVNGEIDKKSIFYNKNILGSDYLELLSK